MNDYTKKEKAMRTKEPTRQDNNSALKAPKKVTLTGSERAFIERAIEKVPNSARTATEIRLRDKVTGQ